MRTVPRSLILAAGLAVLGPVAVASPGYAAPSAAPRAPSIAAGTRTDLLSAMHGEALARASYLAYAGQATREGRRDVARLFTDTATVEHGDHFTLEAAFVGLAGPDAANLREAIAGESYEITTMYPTFEARARSRGDRAAAAAFHEIAADEVTHRALYRQALAALAGHGRVPSPPSIAPVTVTAGPARSSGATLADLRTAMGGESYASVKYLAYADHARRSGHPDLARLFTRISDVELREHFAQEAILAGLVSRTRANLLTAMNGENREGTRMYPDYARQAAARGDVAVARTLREIAADERAHRDAFARQLRTLPR